MKTLKPLRVLVCGGRYYGKGDDGRAWAKMVSVMNAISACGKRQVTVIHGGATGADAMAGRWAFNTNTPYEVYPADWDRLGRSAGAERNTQMLLEGKPNLVVAFPGGSGTADMVAKARAMNVRVYEVAE